MLNKDIYMERDKVYALNELETVALLDYDLVQLDQLYIVPLRTGGCSVYRKNKNFDDEFLKLLQDFDQAVSYITRPENRKFTK